MRRVFTAICWKKGVSYVITTKENQSLWKGRLAPSKGGAKLSPWSLLSVVSVAIDWHFLAWFLKEATPTSESWSPCRLLTTVASGYGDKKLQTLTVAQSSSYQSHCGYQGEACPRHRYQLRKQVLYVSRPRREKMKAAWFREHGWRRSSGCWTAATAILKL